MVFFVCDGCNESLKKNQVDKHAARCARCYSVTCVDCQQTFPGNDYAKHVTCVTEAEKYEKGLHQGKKKNKLNPQDLWAETIQEASVNAHKAPSNIQHYLPKIAECGNVPRNKNKFMNFAKNSLRVNSIPILESIWTFLESFKSTSAASTSAASTSPTSPTSTSNNQTSVVETQSDEQEEQPTASSISVTAGVKQENGLEEEKKQKKEKKKKNKSDLKESSSCPPTQDLAPTHENGSHENGSHENEMTETNKEKKTKKRKKDLKEEEEEDVQKEIKEEEEKEETVVVEAKEEREGEGEGKGEGKRSKEKKKRQREEEKEIEEVKEKKSKKKKSKIE